ncbi:MAG: hypothetical protein A3J97_04965 [Spirochaetes bacterium RIFOXYC1_FULL_54_7]|nr:MAG: hypothetical protein A3J97_04965 [Spirochaetes bacterium RIFOXYC1_FULL_54_7]
MTGEIREPNKSLLFLDEIQAILKAVQVWIDTGLFGDVQDIQRGIMDTYIDDFAKYARQTQ